MHAQDIDPAFGNWLAGLVDGEGHFAIFQRIDGDAESYVCRFSIEFRDDELPGLREIRARTGIGVISRRDSGGRSKPSARWSVSKKAELLRLVAIFDAYPLRMKKARDYEIWREAVLLWAGTQQKRNRWGALPCDWTRIAYLHDALRDARRYQPAPPRPEPEPPIRLWED